MSYPPAPPSAPTHPLAGLGAPSHPSPLASTSSSSAPPHPHLGTYTYSPESSAHSPHNVAEGSASKKRKVEASGHAGLQQGSGEGSKKRQVLSCTECKRRKIKCDRKIPCLACCKRGDPTACKWSDEVPTPDPVSVQPFALTSDLLKLARRLQSLEEWAHSLPPEIREQAPPPPLKGEFVPEVYASKVKKGKEKEKEVKSENGRKNGRSEQPTRQESLMEEESMSGPPSRDLSDSEDAAVKLESIAFSARAPNTYWRVQDSLPFFDTMTSAPSGGHVSTAMPRPSFATTHAELTSMGTSIVGPPVVYDGPWSATGAGLDLCFSLEEFRAARKKTLDALWSMLPDRTLSDKLMQKYFVEVAFLHHVLHRESFEAEHDRAWEMVAAGRRDEIDPMWLSVWCMVLCLAIDGLRCQQSEILLTPEEQRRCNSFSYYACMQRFAQMGDGLGRPQIRFVQSIILAGSWLQTSAVSGQAARFLVLLAAAIRVAQVLGLHQLSDDPSHMPPPDPAWPPNACSLRREMALRLFGLLSFLDYISATTRFRGYILDPAQCTTPPVSNLDLCQLSIHDWKVEPYPPNVRTDSSFERAKFFVCRAAREVFGKVVLSTAPFSYDTVLELDAKYRKILGDFDAATPSPTKTLDEATERWQKLVCVESAHFRVLRLHRPFMAKNEFSRRACLESAEKIIRADLFVIASTNSNAWFAYSHTLGAAICLFSDLFNAIDNGLAEAEIEQKKTILVQAFEIFGRHETIQLPLLRQVVKTGARILSGLFMAEEKRRVTRAASALVPGSRANEAPPESFTAVLQRLSREVAAAPPTPPLPANTTLPPAYPAEYSAQPPSALPSYPSAQPPSSMFASVEPPPQQPGLFSLPFDLNESTLPSEFFRDGGLGSGLGSSFDFLSGFGPNALGASGGEFVHPVQPQPLPSGAPGPYFGPVPGEWSFEENMGGVVGGEGNKISASALMDELAGGVW
ncbi:hypothetical protein JCM8547_005106 [Rhodosporidiobolus lusitaniae]